MDPAALLQLARRRSGLTLRQLARRAGTSHSTLSAYEHGRKDPTARTVERVLRAAGFTAEVELVPLPAGDPADRGRELVAVLELAEQFPARFGPVLDYPRFGAA